MAIIIHMPSVKRGKRRTGSSSDAPKDPTLENSDAPLVQPESLSDNSGVGDREGEEIYEDDVGEDEEEEEEEEDDEEEEVLNRSFDSLPYDEDDEEEEEEVEVREEEEEEEVGDEERDNLVHIEEFENEGQFDEEEDDDFVGGINEQIENAAEEEFDEWEEYEEEILEVEWGYINQVEEDDGDGSVVDPVEFNSLMIIFYLDHVSNKRRRHSI